MPSRGDADVGTRGTLAQEGVGEPRFHNDIRVSKRAEALELNPGVRRGHESATGKEVSQPQAGAQVKAAYAQHVPRLVAERVRKAPVAPFEVGTNECLRARRTRSE